MGLAQRAIEEAGIATVSLSMIPELTRSVGAPRVAAISFPVGRPFGPPGDADLQRAILGAALGVLEKAERPGDIVDLPFEWPRGLPTRCAPTEIPPIGQLIRRRPWLFRNLMNLKVPALPTPHHPMP